MLEEPPDRKYKLAQRYLIKLAALEQARIYNPYPSVAVTSEDKLKNHMELADKIADWLLASKPIPYDDIISAIESIPMSTDPLPLPRASVGKLTDFDLLGTAAIENYRLGFCEAKGKAIEAVRTILEEIAKEKSDAA